MTKNIAIIFAGGTGTRMGKTGKPKQFLKVYGKPIIIYTIEHFQNNPDVDEIYISCLAPYIDYLKSLINLYNINKVVDVIPGGKTGQDSIYNALKETEKNNPDNDDIVVLLHDGVRPVITQKLISDNIANAREKGNSITCTPCFETILISTDGENVEQVPYRKDTYAAQAPQTFFLKEILDAHEKERQDNPTYENIVDGCTLFKKQNKTVHMVEGNKGNIKITTPEDYFIFKALLKYMESEDVLGLGSMHEGLTL